MALSSEAWSGVAWSLPWWLLNLATAWRWRGSPRLDDMSADLPNDAPLLSVIVPARNESHHIGDCVRSILASRYAPLEVIVVDDHSSDGTGAFAREAAGGDSRLLVIEPPPLPDGWLGKQWACEHGASHVRGDVLLFTDADVRHAPDLHPRMLQMMARDQCDLLSIAGHQETRTFWERVVQPFVFSVLAQRYGGVGAVNRSRRTSEKIANGQCLAFRRDAYEQFGRHAVVRDRAAEDLAFAQEMYARGFRTQLALGSAHMSTRMYSSLGEIVAGWRKNVFAAGRGALPGGARTAPLARALVPFPGVGALFPVVALIIATRTSHAPAWEAFGASATLAQLLWFAFVAREFRISPAYALTFPLGALVFLYIAVTAVARGQRIEWKGRTYQAR